MSRPIATWAFRLAVLAGVAAATYLRDPSLFETPRFWAEEGSHYFASATAHDFRAGLANLRAAPHNPYLHAIPQLSTVVAAHAFPLRDAPAVTTGAWTLVFMAYVLIALCSRAELVRTAPRRALVAASPLLVVCTTENWANTLGAHFYVDAAMLLLLLEAPHVQGRRRRISEGAFTLLAFLSPTSWFLVPAALVLNRRRPGAYASYLVRLCAVVVVHTLIAIALYTDARPERSLAAMPHIFLSKCILWPFLGREVAGVHAQWVFELEAASFALWSLVSALVATALFGLYVRCSSRDDTVRALLATYFTAVAGFLLLGIGITRDLMPLHHAARYAWLPNLLLIWLLLHEVDLNGVRGLQGKQLAFAALLTLTLRAGSGEFYPTTSYESWAGAPDWQDEVREFWESPARTSLRIAPAGWTVVIDSEARKRLER